MVSTLVLFLSYFTMLQDTAILGADRAMALAPWAVVAVVSDAPARGQAVARRTAPKIIAC